MSSFITINRRFNPLLVIARATAMGLSYTGELVQSDTATYTVDDNLDRGGRAQFARVFVDAGIVQFVWDSDDLPTAKDILRERIGAHLRYRVDNELEATAPGSQQVAIGSSTRASVAIWLGLTSNGWDPTTEPAYLVAIDGTPIALDTIPKVVLAADAIRTAERAEQGDARAAVANVNAAADIAAAKVAAAAYLDT